jgi:FdhE protein
MIRSKWDQRIRRADELAAQHPFAAEVLLFYSHVTRFQKDLYANMAGVGADLSLLAPRFPDFLEHIAAAAPEPLAQCARDLRKASRRPGSMALNSFWRGAAIPAGAGPRAGAAGMHVPAALRGVPGRSHEPMPSRETSGTCPFCRARPIAGVLRPEGDGGKRSLICALCATEWNIGRMVCPACGEQTVEKLAVYTADQFPHVRVEACDTCRYYIKTVDLTKNGNAVPVVDELATIPLDLWAQQHDYVKLRANLLGL